MFDYIAACLANFMEIHNLMIRERLPLGFTFSFPCKQTDLDKATLINWTKEFTASGVEGRDVVKLLRNACVKRGVISYKLLLIILKKIV